MRYAATTREIPGMFPPRVLSMEDYERDWKPDGWNLIIIGPTSTWRQEWGEWEAIRDIVQNALDEAESYSFGYDNGLWIANTGRGIAVADFLLGPPKLKPDYARGKFGEGMKIGALALLRKGYSIHVNTANREFWVVFIEQKVNGRIQTLAAIWRKSASTRVTRFHIIGYNGPSFDRYFAVNLPKSLILAKVPSPITEPKLRVNELIKAEGMASSSQGGVIYARDIYLRPITSPFSYNLWGFELAPDRHGPKNEADMWVDMGRLWCGVDKVPLLESFLRMVLDPPLVETEESRQIRMDSYEMGSEPVTNHLYSDLVIEHTSAWQAAWRKIAGADAVISTNTRWDNMIKHLGYNSVRLQWGVRDVLSKVIGTDIELIGKSQERLSESAIIPDDKLSLRELANLTLARKIAAKFGVKRVYAAIIPPASDRMRTAGLYNYPLEEIQIAMEQLDSVGRTLDTTIHELGHHQAYKWAGDITKAEDLTPLHSARMTEVAAYVIEHTVAGNFDEEFKGAQW